MILDVRRDHFVLALTRVSEIIAALPANHHWLSPSELERYKRLNHPGRRDEFLAGRWLIRQCFVRRFGGAPSDWPLIEEVNLPPRLDGKCAFGHLSISHGGGFVAAAIAEQPIGVDVESRFRDLPQAVFEPLFGTSDTTNEQRVLRWVVTEAFLKQQTLPAHTDTLRRHRLQPVGQTPPRVKAVVADDHVFAVAGGKAVLDDAAFFVWSGWA